MKAAEDKSFSKALVEQNGISKRAGAATQSSSTILDQPEEVRWQSTRPWECNGDGQKIDPMLLSSVRDLIGGVQRDPARD